MIATAGTRCSTGRIGPVNRRRGRRPDARPTRACATVLYRAINGIPGPPGGMRLLIVLPGQAAWLARIIQVLDKPDRTILSEDPDRLDGTSGSAMKSGSDGGNGQPCGYHEAVAPGANADRRFQGREWAVLGAASLGCRHRCLCPGV